MALFLSILEGETAECATPVLATRDERIIQAVIRELSQRLGIDGTSEALLRLVQNPENTAERTESERGNDGKTK